MEAPQTGTDDRQFEFRIFFWLCFEISPFTPHSLNLKIFRFLNSMTLNSQLIIQNLKLFTIYYGWKFEEGNCWIWGEFIMLILFNFRLEVNFVGMVTIQKENAGKLRVCFPYDTFATHLLEDGTD
jgi:hypothetical protein